LLWALHIVIKQQFFYIYINIWTIFQYLKPEYLPRIRRIWTRQ